MENDRIAILGAGESGVGAALLASARGYMVWLSDNGAISQEYRAEIEENEISFEEGGHTRDRILKAGIIVKSPGIPDTAPIVQEAKENGIEVISEIEFACRFTDKPIIAITGSNGKTTTTLLIHHLLTSGGIDAALAGNIGSSLARHVLADTADLFVVEVSSFQLDGCTSFAPQTAVLLNITPDHLDRYDNDFEKYAQSKLSICKNMHGGNLVYNLEDPELRRRIDSIPGQIDKSTISLTEESRSYAEDGRIVVVYNEREIEFQVDQLPLQGEHNQLNIMAAVNVAMMYGIDNESIHRSLPSFKNHPNRLEFVANINGVDFINDSKATNVEAAFYALGSFEKPIVWIAGGQDKGNDYSQIEQYVKDKVSAMVCLGVDNTKLIEKFGSFVGSVAEVKSTDEAAEVAYNLADNKAVVLLSPACASFDLFDNYAQRGEFFKKSVLNLKEKLK
jgi:UDP-N-acetylmuramoylalanine--D-glutamate ligase